jgi:hypothetical protein
VQRGTCGHDVGTVSIGFSATLTVLPSRSHGLADLNVEGLSGTATYTFDGTRYVVQKANKIDPATDYKNKQEGNQQGVTDSFMHAQNKQDIAATLADEVTIVECKTTKLDRAHAADALAGKMLVYLSQRKCDTKCCTFSAKPDEAPGGDVGAFVHRVCATAMGDVERVEIQCDSTRGP